MRNAVKTIQWRVYCVAVQFDYIQVLQLKCDNMCVEDGIPEMVANFKEVSRCSTPFVTPVVVIGQFWRLLHSVTPAGHPGPAFSPRPSP